MFKVWIKIADGVIEQAYQLWHGFLSIESAQAATSVLEQHHVITDPQGSVVLNTENPPAEETPVK